MITRCKFTCQSVKKKTDWRDKSRFLYEAEFSIVYESTEENKKFFDATPSGSFNISTYKEDVFTPGKDYYLDISEVEND